MPAGTQKLAERPSKLISWEMMKSLVALVLKDWGGADVTIFENHEDCWVIKVGVLGRRQRDGGLGSSGPAHNLGGAGPRRPGLQLVWGESGPSCLGQRTHQRLGLGMF